MSALMKLEVFQDGQLLQEIPFEKDEIWVGREEGCVIRLEDRAISRRHALLKSTGQGIEFEKKSKFGWVKVNGQEATQTMLKDGDRLEMGPYEIRVSGKDAPAGASASAAPSVLSMGPAQPLEVAMDQAAPIELGATPIEGVESLPAMPATETAPEKIEKSSASMEIEADPNVGAIGIDLSSQPEGHTQSIDMASISTDGATKVFSGAETVKAILQFNDGEANVSQYEISDQEVAIGRSQQCHIVLEDKRSSRKHSIIRREGKKYFLKDLGSANGTLLNGARIDDVELQPGDQIQIGETKFEFKIVQSDYEVKKEGFIAVPQQENPQSSQLPQSVNGVQPIHALPEGYGQPNSFGSTPTPQPEFSAPPAEKRSILGKYIDRYRAMNTKQQIIWGALILTCVWFLLEEDPVPQERARLNTGVKTQQAKPAGAKKPGEGMSFEALTPEQKRYIETQYQLAFDLYKNREYDKALLEIGKIFSLVQDYKNAREIEAFAREGKRKLEAQEEERKRKEAERQAQLKLQSLIDQAGMLMDKKRFHEAEALFPEIELIQPENAAVNDWRRQIELEGARVEQERELQRKIAEQQKKAWSRLQVAIEMKTNHEYQRALDELDIIDQMTIQDPKLKRALKDENASIRSLIANERDPLNAQGRELEQSGQLAEAFKLYEKAHAIDPEDTVSEQGMARIHGSLTARAKAIYIEGVFAESYNDLEAAERSYREILGLVPKKDDYYIKAESRLKRITAFRKPAAESSETQ